MDAHDLQNTAGAPCVLLDSAAGTGGMAVTGIDLMLPLGIAAAVLVLGVALILVARRRRSADSTGRRDGALSAAVAALIGFGVAVALLAGPVSAVAAEQISAQAGGCELIDFAVERDSADSTVIGGVLAPTERVTVTNVTDGTIAVAFSTDVLADIRQLAPFVRVVADCGCASAPLIDSILAGTASVGRSVRVGSGQSVVVTVRAATTESITNDLQGSELTYALVAHATEVSA